MPEAGGQGVIRVKSLRGEVPLSRPCPPQRTRYYTTPGLFQTYSSTETLSLRASMPAATAVWFSLSLLFTSLDVMSGLLCQASGPEHCAAHPQRSLSLYFQNSFKSKEVSQEHCSGDELVESLALRCPLTSGLSLLQAWRRGLPITGWRS